ncbi:MAG: dTDP-4-dehydrorhamnose reductase [Actinomycetota bacterium]|nr:dTDP-4-dehydrorhamnose reductase [Actinomycetota bacterium]
MRTRTVLVTGAAGQVGREVVACFECDPAWQVVPCDRAQLDLADRDAVLGAITTVAPDAVVHCGAWTAVDACEEDPDRALAVNALGTRHVADAARRVGASVTYLSTDYVFAGNKQGPYHEWDETGPRSAYGRSKLAGERELDPGSTIVRTSWVFGRHGANMVKTILRLASAGDDELRFVDDQHGCPTAAADLAGAVHHLVGADRPGTFHVTNQGPTTWFAFAQDVLRLAGEDPGRVRPVATSELDPPRPAPRPANSVLDGAALRLSGLPLLRDHHEPLAELVRELRA